MSKFWNNLKLATILGVGLTLTGCTFGRCSTCSTGDAGVCESAVCQSDCNTCGRGWGIRRCGCGTPGRNFFSNVDFALFGWAWRKPNAITETLPLGSTVRAHDQVMQTNAESMDFIINQHDFIGQTAQLTPDGRDKVLEIAARMRSAPFPVIIERTWNNADPELDTMRRNLVATVLTDLGNMDAQQRTVVSTPYGPGYLGTQAERMYYQHTYNGGGNNNLGNNGGGFGGGGLGGGGGFGGGGGGGGFF